MLGNTGTPLPSIIPRPFPHNGTYSFNKPWCFSLNEITASMELFIKNFFFWWSLHLSAFEPPSNNPPKKYIQFQRFPTLSPIPETSPGETWTQSFITNFLSFNPRKYESNHHKQGLLFNTSKIFHYLLQLQVIKVIKFHLRSACHCKFHVLTPLLHTPKTHSVFFNSLR